MMKPPFCSSALLSALICLVCVPCARAVPAVVFSPAPPCGKGQLSVRLDDRGGYYNGMSQNGTDLVLQNTGKTSCRLPALPELTFSDRHHHTLPVQRKISPGMHPGPVLLPVSIATGEDVRIPLRWVSGEVFEHGHCVSPAYLSLTVPDGERRLPFDRMMCAAAGQSGYYVQSPVTGRVD